MNLFDTIKSFFNMAYLNEEMEKEFLIEESKKIIKYMKFILFIIPVFQIYNIIHTLIYTDFTLRSVASKVYTVFYIIMLIVSLVVILIGVNMDKSNYRGIINLQFVFSFFYIFWIASVTLYDQRVGNNISQYVTGMMFIGLLVYMTPIQAVFIFSIPAILFVVALNIFDKTTGSQHYGAMVSTICIAFSAIFISVYKFSRERQSFCEKKIIISQKNEIEEKNKMLKNLLEHDSLTGLYNRRFFDENIDNIFKSVAVGYGYISIFVIDIDNFKLFNDYFGHQKGDDILRIVSQTIISNIKYGYAVRYGGEEICVVVPNMKKGDAKNLSCVLLNSIRNLNIPTAIENVNLSISLGVHTEKVYKHTLWNDIFEKADKALYYVKNNGKNNFMFFDDLNF